MQKQKGFSLGGLTYKFYCKGQKCKKKVTIIVEANKGGMLDLKTEWYCLDCAEDKYAKGKKLVTGK